MNAVDKHYNGGKLTEGVCYPVQAEVGSSGGYSWVRIFVAGVQRYAAVLADRCRLVTLSPGDAFAACVAQGGDAAGQRAQRDGRQAGAYAPVSYTHLDVYKRQAMQNPQKICRRGGGRTASGVGEGKIESGN